MDLPTLVSSLVGLLVPSLSTLIKRYWGSSVPSSAPPPIDAKHWKYVQRAWRALEPVSATQADLKKTLMDVAASPDDVGAQAALRHHLRTLLTSDPKLADELGQIINEVDASTASRSIPPPTPIDRGGSGSGPSGNIPHDGLGTLGGLGTGHESGRDFVDRGPGTLGLEGFFGTPASSPAAQPAPATEKRWVNIEVLDQPKEKPLQLGRVHTLVIDVDTAIRVTSLTTNKDEFKSAFPDGVNSIEVMIQLDSDDFQVLTTEPQRLIVPRAGRSENKARFDIKPLHEGQGRITAFLVRDNNIFQFIKINLQVGTSTAPGMTPVTFTPGAMPSVGGSSMQTSTYGPPVSVGFRVGPRDLSLVIEALATGYKITVLEKRLSALINVTPLQLEAKITQARSDLTRIVQLVDASGLNLVYQRSVDISEEAHQVAVQTLAAAGYDLFTDIFYGPLADANLRQIGDYIRTLARKETLKIKVYSEQFLLPWGMLYLAESYDSNTVDLNLFLGLKHIIEHIPAQPNGLDIDQRIDSTDGLRVSLNVNAGLDTEMNHPFIAEQRDYWASVAKASKVEVVVRTSEAEVRQALANAEPDNILYFNCHAASRGLSDGGSDQSCLLLTVPAQQLTLRDLNRAAPMHTKYLPGAPLVFINACQSAEMSVLFYDGFLPYFMAKGARGVIGTECDIPAIFAAEFARRFFDQFLMGKPLGEILLDLRQDFVNNHNNILGLLYALYCDGDTLVAPALAVPA